VKQSIPTSKERTETKKKEEGEKKLKRKNTRSPLPPQHEQNASLCDFCPIISRSRKNKKVK